MKQFKNIFSFTSLIALFLLSSCLDNTGNLDVFNSVNSKGIISIGQAEPGVNVKTVEILATPTKISVVINAARVNKAVNVTVEVDPTLLTAYNTEQTALDATYVPYEILPANLYTIPSLTVNIPAGKLDTPFDFNVSTSLIDLSKKYALPIALKSVDDPSVVIASNLNSSIVAVVVKNKYDGNYTLAIEHSGWGAPVTSGAGLIFDMPADKPEMYPDGIDLVTLGADAVGIFNVFRGDNLLPGFGNTAGNPTPTGFGVSSPVFRFDSNDKIISVVNALPDDGRGRQFVLNPAAPPTDNFYDPATKKIIANFFFKQNGRPDMRVKWTMVFDKSR
jgi:hypothetical protein